jgi:hypothetical protein
MRMTDLRAGWSVVGNDGRRIGIIQEIGQQYLLVSRGGFAQSMYVPASAIANVERETVHLNLARAEAESMGWQQAPREDDRLRIDPEHDVDRHV